MDATIYNHIVGSPMYLVNTIPYIFYTVKELIQAMVKPTKLFWKAREHVLRYIRGTRDYAIMVQMDRGSEASRLQRCRLGRNSIRHKKNMRRDLQHRIDSSFLVQQEGEICGTQFSRGRVHGS